MTPRTTIDIFALPKSTFFVTGILILTIFMMLYRQNVLAITKDKLCLVLFALALCTLIIPMLSNSFTEERLFGIHGRFNGALVYFSLILSLIFVRVVFSQDTTIKAMKLGAIANLIVSSYFILQLTGYDFLKWKNVYQDPSSTMGNPNFVSGFLATTTFTYLSFAIQQSKSHKKNILRKALSFVGVGFSIICIVLTNSALGLFSVFASFAVIILTSFIRLVPKISSVRVYFKWTILITLFCIPSAVIFVFFWNRLESILSFSNRLYYWKVSLDAIERRPFQGYGFDSTGDFFRTIERVEKYGPIFGVDSSHNLVIDLISWMGIPLGIFLVGTILAPLILSVNNQIAKRRVSSLELAVAASVMTFLIQATISVPTIGVNCWGFVFIGILWNQVRPIENRVAVKESNFRLKSIKVGITFILLPLVPLFPIRFAKDVEFRNFAESGNVLPLINLVQKWPNDSFHYLTLTHSLYMSNQQFLAREIGKRGVEFNPKNFMLLDEIYREEKDPAFREEIFVLMKDINPLLRR